MVLFTKENMDEDKYFPVVILPPMRCVVGLTRQVMTGSIQG